jgi:nitrite reductase/ring-hydroxylating ferredoxin subunit
VRHELFPLETLEPGSKRCVDIAGIDVVVIRTKNGRVHALRNRCPHAGAQLSYGRVLSRVVTGENGSGYALDEDVIGIRCPWHALEFDLETGRCFADPERYRVRVYDVSVENGMVYLER